MLRPHTTERWPWWTDRVERQHAALVLPRPRRRPVRQHVRVHPRCVPWCFLCGWQAPVFHQRNPVASQGSRFCWAGSHPRVLYIRGSSARCASHLTRVCLAFSLASPSHARPALHPSGRCNRRGTWAAPTATQPGSVERFSAPGLQHCFRLSRQPASRSLDTRNHQVVLGPY